MSNYKHFDSLRKKTNSSFRNDGGVSVFVREEYILNCFVKRLYVDFTDSVVLLLNASRFDVKKDIILLIAYISPEGSPIYRNKDECNGILLLENKLAQIKDDYPECLLYLAGDLNARTFD